MSKSHTYAFGSRALLMTVCLPLLPVAGFALLMQWGASAGLLPKPCPALDIDRTILLHQADASLRPHRADLLLLGDSSCLMDVQADQLSALRNEPGAVLNLGTLSYLDLDSFKRILEHYLAANPSRPRALVLLMHPEALRRPAAADYDVQVLEHFYAGTDDCEPPLPALLCQLGVETFRGRLLSRIVPQALPGKFGQEYGFTHDLWQHLTLHDGSAFDPGTFDSERAQGNREYRLSSHLQPASERFRAALPRGVQLAVGITPLPEGYADPRFAAQRDQMLRTWSRWLQADLELSSFPAVLPDRDFASTTHLNPAGAGRFTLQLARALEAYAAALHRSSHPNP